MDEIQNLKESFERDGNWAELSAWAIIGGLALEVCLLLWFSKDRSSFETLSLIAANGIIAGGVFGEIHFGRRVATVSKRLQQISDEKVAEATARASEANQKAQEAILELAKFRASRTLTGQQMVRAAGKLKQFSGTEYDMALHSNDPELTGFLCFIETALLKAGWKALSWPAAAMFITPRGIQVAVGISVTNIVVGMHLEKVSLLLPAAKCLADELMVAGNATVTPMPDSHGMSPNTTAIHILIGRKS